MMPRGTPTLTAITTVVTIRKVASMGLLVIIVPITLPVILVEITAFDRAPPDVIAFVLPLKSVL